MMLLPNYIRARLKRLARLGLRDAANSSRRASMWMPVSPKQRRAPSPAPHKTKLSHRRRKTIRHPSVLPESWTADKSDVFKYAADATGRLYMFMNQPANAKQYLEAVINSGKYAMAPNYLDRFTDAYMTTIRHATALWEVTVSAD